MKFDNAAEVEMLCYMLRQSDFPRAQNRALINNLFNGVPPYTEEEVQQNGININVNDLSSTRVGHDARSQMYSAFLKPGNYFKASTDMGPVHKRSARSAIVTREVNRRMRKSLAYFECFRSQFAMDVLHGIGPCAWEDSDHWCPEPIGVEDVMIPAKTLLTMKNLPFFAIYHSYTAPELMKLTRGPNVDKAWNLPLVNSCLEWIDRETLALMGSNWPEVWSPEKAAERVKGDGGFYVGDQVPTIDVWDLYFYNEDGKVDGWNRRMILDSWSTPQSAGGPQNWSRKTQEPFVMARDQFLYNSRNRKVASRLNEIITWQFADLSAVAPFQYHSVRSLGFLLYAVCHLQNRMRCKFNEAVFEALMMYFRVKSMDDAQRALKLELYNKGFIDETIQIVPAAERFQVNAALVELGLRGNQELIQQNTSSYRPTTDYSENQIEKTKFQVMTEAGATTALVSSALLQAYRYQAFQYFEIFRRFCKRNSKDVDVRDFRAACLRQGVPENMLVPEAWEIEPERVMGAGNKAVELAIAQQLMEYRKLYDPEPQREILRDVTLAITDDAARAEALVPQEQEKVTDAVHDAQLASGSLMMGLPVAVKTGLNHIDYVETLLANMALLIARVQQSGGMASAEKIAGFQNMAQHIAQHIGIIAQDQDEKDRVKQYGDQLGKLMNLVKAFAQRLAQAMKARNGQGGGMDPKEIAKIQAETLRAKSKVELGKQSHAQRTAQRQVQFEQDMRQKSEEHRMDMIERADEIQLKRNRPKPE